MTGRKKVDLSRANRLINHGPVVLVTCGTIRSNIITIGWSTPVSHRPPLVAISVGTTRYSCGLIEETPEFVINVPSAELLRSVWICGTKSGRDVDKFEEAGLTRAPAQEVSVPLIAECMGWLECRVRNRIELGDHLLFVGEVLHASVRDEAFDQLYRLGPSGRTLHHLGESSFALSGSLVDAREGGAS
jgi:flavin reductase (DIM6/NTAB) family NADH-FMN oxidoreductase RutF